MCLPIYQVHKVYCNRFTRVFTYKRVAVGFMDLLYPSALLYYNDKIDAATWEKYMGKYAKHIET